VLLGHYCALLLALFSVVQVPCVGSDETAAVEERLMHNAQQEPSDILELVGWFGSHSRKLLGKNSHKQVHKKLLRSANKASRHRASTKRKRVGL
jgi:hypothetical protein